MKREPFTFPPLVVGIMKLLVENAYIHVHVELSKVITITSSEQDIQGGYRVGTFITTRLRS